jgi:hypothetical protein
MRSRGEAARRRHEWWRRDCRREWRDLGWRQRVDADAGWQELRLDWHIVKELDKQYMGAQLAKRSFLPPGYVKASRPQPRRFSTRPTSTQSNWPLPSKLSCASRAASPPSSRLKGE